MSRERKLHGESWVSVRQQVPSLLRNAVSFTNHQLLLSPPSTADVKSDVTATSNERLKAAMQDGGVICRKG